MHGHTSRAPLPRRYDLKIYVSSVAMPLHFIIYIAVTEIGKLTLSLVATKNASLHLLFPFQMFDFLFLVRGSANRKRSTTVAPPHECARAAAKANHALDLSRILVAVLLLQRAHRADGQDALLVGHLRRHSDPPTGQHRHA